MNDFENAPAEQETSVEVSGQEEAENLFKSLFPSGGQETEDAEEAETIAETEATNEEAQESTASSVESDLHRELAELKQLLFSQNPQAYTQHLTNQYGVAPAGLQSATVPQVTAQIAPQATVPADVFSVESLAQKFGYDVDDLDDDTIQGLKVQSAMMQDVVNGALKPFFDEVLTPQRAELEKMKAEELKTAHHQVGLNSFAGLGSNIPAISVILDKYTNGTQFTSAENEYLDVIYPIFEAQKQQVIYQMTQDALKANYTPEQLNDLWKSPQFAKQAERTISKNVAGIASTLAKGLGLTASKGSIRGVVKSVAPTAVSTPSSNKYSVNDALKTGNALDVTMAILGNIK